LADTPLSDEYDNLRVDFYFSVLDLVLASISVRFAGKNKVIMEGVAALLLSEAPERLKKWYGSNVWRAR
jgi:hypothetical protein